MNPPVAVSGWQFAHPKEQYFAIGKIGRDQLEDYVRRKGLTLPEMERWVISTVAGGVPFQINESPTNSGEPDVPSKGQSSIHYFRRPPRSRVLSDRRETRTTKANAGQRPKPAYPEVWTPIDR